MCHESGINILGIPIIAPPDLFVMMNLNRKFDAATKALCHTSEIIDKSLGIPIISPFVSDSDTEPIVDCTQIHYIILF